MGLRSGLSTRSVLGFRRGLGSGKIQRCGGMKKLAVPVGQARIGAPTCGALRCGSRVFQAKGSFQQTIDFPGRLVGAKRRRV